MAERAIKIPGPDHPITIEPNPRRVRVTFAGKVIADTTAALILREASYPAVHYIPRADVDMKLLERSDLNSYCPYKGEASYYSVAVGAQRSEDAIWTYEEAYPAVDAIRNYLAFYPDRVDSIEEL